MELRSLLRQLRIFYSYFVEDWRGYCRQLLLVAIKSFLAYLFTFIIFLTIFTALTPEYPDQELHLIFRVNQDDLVGIAIRQELRDSVCNTRADQEFIFKSKFPKDEICYLMHHQFPKLKNRHFNLLVTELDPRIETVMVCWLRHGNKDEVCEELVVKDQEVRAQSIDILTVDLVEVILRGDEKRGDYEEPEVYLELNEGAISSWLRMMYGPITLIASHGIGLTICLLLAAREILKFWRQFKEATAGKQN